MLITTAIELLVTTSTCDSPSQAAHRQGLLQYQGSAGDLQYPLAPICLCAVSHGSSRILQAHALPLQVLPRASPGFHPIPRISPRPKDSMETCACASEMESRLHRHNNQCSSCFGGDLTQSRDLLIVLQRCVIWPRYNVQLKRFSARQRSQHHARHRLHHGYNLSLITFFFFPTTNVSSPMAIASPPSSSSPAKLSPIARRASVTTIKRKANLCFAHLS